MSSRQKHRQFSSVIKSFRCGLVRNVKNLQNFGEISQRFKFKHLNEDVTSNTVDTY